MRRNQPEPQSEDEAIAAEFAEFKAFISAREAFVERWKKQQKRREKKGLPELEFVLPPELNARGFLYKPQPGCYPWCSYHCRSHAPRG